MESRSHDVVVMGGGLAGLGLSIQLKRSNPDIDVLVAERTEHPPPAAAHKVGESTLEAQAHYLSDILGLKDYLETEQLRKAGLRFFFSDGENTDIARRVEFGPNYQLAWPSYQLDRGTLEAKLGEYARELGVEFMDKTTVRDVTVGDGDSERHKVKLKHDGEEIEVDARWVVDATGRFGLLKRKLELAKPVDHKANASWWRIPVKIDPEEWSDDQEWKERMEAFRFDDGREGKMRYQSTNHLAGHGYWVWFIPLANDITSVGIVVDDSIHPISEINTLEKSMKWLEEHEPQAYEAVLPHVDDVMDFKFLRHYSLNCERVYSPQRWCITGIAGAFHDPLFSFGGDMIGFSNTFVADLITRDMGGESISARTDLYNHIFLNQFVSTVFTVFTDKYPLLGNAQIFSFSVHWTTTWYWSVIANLFLHDKITDLEFLGRITDDLARAEKLMGIVQQFFVDWYEKAGNATPSEYFIPYCCHQWIRRLQEELKAPFSDDELVAKFKSDVANLERLANEIFWMGVEHVIPDAPERRPIDPYKMTLDPSRWEADGLFDGAPGESPDEVDWEAEIKDYLNLGELAANGNGASSNGGGDGAKAQQANGQGSAGEGDPEPDEAALSQ